MMAIKVNLESTIIPVEVGNLRFTIDINDEKYEQFIQEFNQFLTEVQKLDEEKVEDMAKMKSMMKDIYTSLLGAGSFGAVYEQVPNIALVASTFVQIVMALKDEMDKKTNISEITSMLEKAETKSTKE